MDEQLLKTSGADILSSRKKLKKNLKGILWYVEACVAERLTPLDLEVRCSRLVHHVVSLDMELYSTLSLFTQVYKWIPAAYCWGVTLRWTCISSRKE